MLEVVESRWAGHNPHVTEANVRMLDMANGGGALARFRSTPPMFRPVAEYEAGRPAMIAGGYSEPMEPPRYGGGGFFRRVFGR